MNIFTFFLAQVFGPLLLIFGLGMLFNRKFYMQMFKNIDQPSAANMMSMMFMIIVGMVLVLNHFLWGTLPEIFISVIALGFLVKGAFWALFPKFFGKITQSVVSSKLLVLPMILWIIAGAYLMWIGFGG